MMIKVFLFDLNGVVVNSEELNFQTWKRIFSEYSFKLDWITYATLIDGKTTDEVSRLLLRIKCHQSIAAVRRYRDEVWFNLFSNYGGVVAFGDAIDFIKKAIHNKIHCIAVSSSRKAKFILEHLKLDHLFECVLDGNSIQKGKPDPEIIFKALNFAQIPACDAVLFEDSIAGLQAGKEANVTCVSVRCKNEGHSKWSDFSVNSFNELCFDNLVHGKLRRF